jgi:hypothetical protein
LKGTCWEQSKNEKNPYSPCKTLKKKIKALSMHVKPSHWLHEISISKIVHHHFWPMHHYCHVQVGKLFNCFIGSTISIIAYTI